MASEKKTEKISSYSYIATNPETGVVRGEVRAINQDTALIQFDQNGFRTYFCFREKESILEMQITFFEKVPPGDIYNFTRQLSVMLKAGVPLVDALDSVHSDKTNALLNQNNR